MIEDVITIWPKATVQNAKKKMIDNKIGCLPVVDHGNLVGIITKSDILKIYNDQSADGK
jgi:acetoin utilization protein AcuB